MINLENILYNYDNNVNALKKINIKIEEGESVAFIGANGSGKSTLMKVISGLIFPQGGVYRFCSEEITAKKMQDSKTSKLFHKRVGFVFQNSDAQLFCPNVYDEIAFGPRQMNMDEHEVQNRVYDILKMLDISSLKDRQPYHLSGGEKKKVAIAAVLVLNPEVILFDEPMNGLDPKTKRFLRKFMIDLNNAGKTIICSTHDFEYVNDVFKRAVVFSGDHTIIRDGSYSDIINDNKFLYDNNII